MNLIEELRSLDPRDPGRWPLPIRLGAVGDLVRGADVRPLVLRWSGTNKQPELEQREAEEQQLRDEFHDKHAKAVNLERLQAAAEGHRALLRRVAAAAARQDRSAEPAGRHLADRPGRRPRGEAVPAAARAAARISTRSCRSRSASPAAITSSASSSAASRRCRASSRCTTSRSSRSARTPTTSCTLDLTAKTYRYLDEEEIAAAEAEKQQAHAGRGLTAAAHSGGANMQSNVIGYVSAPRSAARCVSRPARLLERGRRARRASSTTRRRSRAAASSRCPR